tara:strand:+ start:281 stop:424 length:144 start_codon:yes stop_codon:yes gene_type:complete
MDMLLFKLLKVCIGLLIAALLIEKTQEYIQEIKKSLSIFDGGVVLEI